jgi:hypothetical protein
MILRVAQGLILCTVVALRVHLALADSPDDCYRLVLVNKHTGALLDLGCPDQSCLISGGDCEEQVFVVFEVNPDTGQLEMADGEACACSGALLPQPCSLYAYSFGHGTAGASCIQTTSCTTTCVQAPLQEFSTQYWRMGDCLCQ